MKVIIDLIEDIRESISNAAEYVLVAALLKEDSSDIHKLIYAGEAKLNTWQIDERSKELCFEINGSDAEVTIGEIIPTLLIFDMSKMMYELKIHVNIEYSDMEIVGFGKNDEEKKYILFIKI